MAEMHIQKKSGTPWIWGVIGLALVAPVACAPDSGERAGAESADTAALAADTSPPTEGVVATAVAAFRSDCTAENGASERDMGVEHTFTVDCLRKLQGGMNAMMERRNISNADVTQRLETYGASVEKLAESDPSAATHAGYTRAAATAAADVFETMDQVYFPGTADVNSATAEVRTAADNIKDDVALLDQQAPVHAFFNRAGDALERMTAHFAPTEP